MTGYDALSLRQILILLLGVSMIVSGAAGLAGVI